MPKRPSSSGWNCAASSRARSKPVATSGHAAQAAASAATAATAAASQADGALRQNAALALRGAAERQDQQRQRADQQDRLHLVLEAEHAQRGGERHPSGRAMRRGGRPRSGSAAQRSTGQAATSSLRRMRECTAMPPENAKARVASSATRQSRTMRRIKAREDQHAAGRDQEASTRPARTAWVMAASKAAASEAGGIADSVHASSRPRACSSRNQDLTDRMVR